VVGEGGEEVRGDGLRAIFGGVEGDVWRGIVGVNREDNGNLFR
jgi:hypothetical protein